jgi:hypothetical protein
MTADPGRTLTDTPFPGDDGSCDPAVRALLAAAADATPTDYLRAVAGLCTSRLLVPIVATRSTADSSGDDSGTVAGDEAADGKESGDKEAEMALALMQTPDGRRGLVAFTGLETLGTWKSDARPVPVTLDRAAGSARDDGADAVLIDIDGPYPLVIEGDVLHQLAAGHRLVELESGQFGWAVPAST